MKGGLVDALGDDALLVHHGNFALLAAQARATCGRRRIERNRRSKHAHERHDRQGRRCPIFAHAQHEKSRKLTQRSH